MAADNVRIIEEKTPVPDKEGNKEEISQEPLASDNRAHTIAADTTKTKETCPSSPLTHPHNYHQAYLPHLTPQPGTGYYLYHQPQVTPEPPSPGGLYDVTSFLRQQAALGANPFGVASQYATAIPQPPLSPRNPTTMMPPPSPLFPRNTIEDTAAGIMPRQSTMNMPYMTSPQLGANFGAMYQGYGANGYVMNNDPGSPDDTGNAWTLSNQQAQNAGYPQASPQLASMMYGGRPTSNNRSQSFDEMLPPSMMEHHDSPYSIYSANQAAAVTGGAPMFTSLPQPAQWGYGATATDMYGAPTSPLQPRPMQAYLGMPHRHMGFTVSMPPPGGGMAQFYPATSPGPPIQTTTSNKGPEGANLFVFHIPNHFTNLDMYSLFCQYGNLLSVRIMVEKDSGRSRGFGFVSYDAPESAAMAIKELNGFAIGNKRLKVQHKQIRSNDQQRGYDMGYGSPQMDMSGGLSSGSSWFDTATQPVSQSGYPDPDEEDHTANAYIDQMGRTGGATGLSPMANMDPLRSALPDLAGSVELTNGSS